MRFAVWTAGSAGPCIGMRTSAKASLGIAGSACRNVSRTAHTALAVASPAEAELFLDEMVGNLQRILLYPRLGYQVEQDVPEDVLAAYRFLQSQGYDRQLMR